jgi:hypothetical protein
MNRKESEENEKCGCDIHDYCSRHVTDSAVTFEISGPPVAGTNAVITSPHATRKKTKK